MRTIYKSIFLVVALSLASCQGLVEGINENPNELLPDDIAPEFFLTGAMLANNVAQAGHMNRIAGMWSGQLTGFTSLYSNIYGYSISTAESIGTWSRVYIGVVTNARYIRERAANDPLLTGISKVLEAHAIGTLASLCGDVPYSEIGNDDISDPRFDSQSAVFQSLVSLLESAATDLGGASSNSALTQDIYFGGDADKWLAAANTLRARYLLQMKDYAGALNAANSGISSSDGTMSYHPQGDPSFAEGDKNLFWTILEGSRAGDIGTGNSHLMQMLDAGSAVSRNHAKTNEYARFHYYTIDEGGGSPNQGIIEQFEPHQLISYEENQLIKAECAARANDFTGGLGHLNDLRAYLNGGGRLNSTFSDSTYLYDAFVATDFDNGGIENADGIDATRALLREIIEERYVSCFGMYIPFNDARRLRKSDGDIAVDIPLNTGTASSHPERLPYSFDELNSNSNAPADDPGILVKTEVNQ